MRKNPEQSNAWMVIIITSIIAMHNAIYDKNYRIIMSWSVLAKPMIIPICTGNDFPSLSKTKIWS